MLVACVACSASAQIYYKTNKEENTYTPTVNYPYLLNDFTEGRAYRQQGKVHSDALFNVSLVGNKLHFVDENDDNIVKECVMDDVDSVRIGEHLFVKYEDMVVRVVAKNKKNMLLKLEYINQDDLFQKMAGLQTFGAGQSASVLHQRFVEDEGSDIKLSLKKKYLMLINGVIVEAKNKDVEKAIERSQIINFRSFVKKNKINWKREEGLIKVLSFF